MKYLAVASGAYSDYSINLFLRVADDFDLSAKVREFIAKVGLIRGGESEENAWLWPDHLEAGPVSDADWERWSECRVAERLRRLREAGCTVQDGLHRYALDEKEAFFLWLQQQPGVEVVDYTEQSVGDYSGLTP